MRSAASPSAGASDFPKTGFGGFTVNDVEIQLRLIAIRLNLLLLQLRLG